MKKIVSFLLLCAAFSVHAATVFTYSSSVEPQTADGITVTLGQGESNTPPTAYDNGIRMYNKNIITVSGENIQKVELEFTKQGSKAYADLTADKGQLVSGGESTGATDKKVDVWTGDATSVVFTLGTSGQRLIKRIVVNRAEGEAWPGDSTDTPEPVDPGEPQQLDSTYVYGDTAIVRTPTQQVQGAAYSFVENNIEVKCTKGGIFETYFACHAGEKITFSATQPFKGIVIKGYVKKDFSCSVNQGTAVYATTDDPDGLAADPVLVITDVDTTSVTISCDKQLRCYEVRVFFAANPEDSIAGGVTPPEGEVFFYEYNTASYLYQPDYSTEGNYNYYIYLWNEESDTVYVGLDIYTSEQGVIEGLYSTDDGSMGDESFYQFGEAYEDYSYATEGMMVINKDGENYSISGYITCENGNTYNFSYTGPIVDEDELYGFEAVESGKAGSQKILRNGQILILRGEKTYTILGAEVQ